MPQDREGCVLILGTVGQGAPGIQPLERKEEHVHEYVCAHVCEKTLLKADTSTTVFYRIKP